MGVGAKKGHIVIKETREKISIAGKGRAAWNKGLKTGPQSEEMKRKKSEKMKGINYGPPCTKETRMKISASQKGKKQSKQTRRKRSEAMKGKNVGPRLQMRGENSPNWNCDITEEERQKGRFYLDYNKWRVSVYERDNYVCQKCNEKGGKLNAHHIEGYNSNRELRVAISNGVTLCKVCHQDFHHQYGKGNNTKYQFEDFIRRVAS